VELEGSSPLSQVPATCPVQSIGPGPRHMFKLRNKAAVRNLHIYIYIYIYIYICIQNESYHMILTVITNINRIRYQDSNLGVQIYKMKAYIYT